MPFKLASALSVSVLFPSFQIFKFALEFESSILLNGFDFAISVLFSFMLFVLLQRVILINFRSLSFDLLSRPLLLLLRLLQPIHQVDDRLNNLRVLNRTTAHHLILVLLEPIGHSVGQLLFLLQYFCVCLLGLVLILRLYRVNIVLPEVVSLFF